MKKLLCLFLFLSACTSKIAIQEPVIVEIEKERAIASDEGFEDAEHEKEFQELFNKDSKAAVDLINSHLINRYQIYVKAHQKLKIFDKDFEARAKDESAQPIDLTESQNYRELIALRIMTEEVLHKSTYYFEQIQNIILNPNEFSRSDLVKAQEIKRGVYGFLFSNRKEALAILRDEMFIEQMVRVKPDADLLKKTYGDLKTINTNLIKQINFEKSELLDKNRLQQIENIQNQIRPIKDRSINSTPKKFASPGAEGNFTGREFRAGEFALTYDDGPSAVRTPQVLANLKKYGVKSTFFWLTKNLKANSEIVQAARQEGMVMGSHSYTHGNIPKLTSEGKDKEISLAVDAARPYLGDIQFYRLPYGSGSRDPDVRGRIAKKGLIHVLWNIDSLDWQDSDPELIFNRTKNQMQVQGRGIVLFHDIHAQSVEASRRLLQYAAENPQLKVRWITMDEALRTVNGN